MKDSARGLLGGVLGLLLALVFIIIGRFIANLTHG